MEHRTDITVSIRGNRTNILSKENLVSFCKSSTDEKVVNIICTFTPTMPMADLLEQSKILKVNRVTESGLIEVEQTNFYTPQKMQDIILDLFEKFDL